MSNSNTPNLQAATGDYYGTMALTLAPHGYRWDFQSAMKDPGADPSLPSSYRDRGQQGCHGPGGRPSDGRGGHDR